MHPIRITTLSLLAAAAMAACSSMPASNAMLDQARGDYREAQTNTQTQALAPLELKQAGDALALAEAAFQRRDETTTVDHLAYLSRQRTALAQEAARRKGSEAAVAAATAERDKLRLDARTRQADTAELRAATANASAATANANAATALRQADAAQQQSAASQQQARDAEGRSQALEAQLREMNARQSDRGMIVTIGDLLFDSGRSELKPGGTRDIERLGSFLKQYPQRKALIEGYTDSVGNSSSNQALSGRRAEAVMSALLDMGVARAQLTAQGYGETHPVAGNDNAGGRQMNRRVEIVLSDENGVQGSR
jgi:outer membrane protein OmpA-like peptidoglycan-associated protein